jgi:hypothetical protein
MSCRRHAISSVTIGHDILEKKNAFPAFEIAADSDTVSYPRRIETGSKKIHGPRRKESCGWSYTNNIFVIIFSYYEEVTKAWA